MSKCFCFIKCKEYRSNKSCIFSWDENSGVMTRVSPKGKDSWVDDFILTDLKDNDLERYEFNILTMDDVFVELL